jgi:hypothetical protein
VAGAEKAFHIDIYYAEDFEGTITEYELPIPFLILFSCVDIVTGLKR